MTDVKDPVARSSIMTSTPSPNDLKRKPNAKILDPLHVANHVTPQGISRERSFIRTSHPTNHFQNSNKRRSVGFAHHQGQNRKPLEIYRPPSIRPIEPHQNKLNVHAQEFNMMRGLEIQNSRSSSSLFTSNHSSSSLQNSKSSGNIHHQIQLAQQNKAIIQHLQQQQQQAMLLSRASLGIHPLGSSPMPLVNSPSSGNILAQASRVVKFAPDSMAQSKTAGIQSNPLLIQPLQRSKSMTSAEITLNRGMANLGIGFSPNDRDIGTFSPEITTTIAKACEDPNSLSSRSLMELATHCMNRAVEGRRYALPISRLCITIISKERKENFLEALLNTCRQWYQEREKVLCSTPNPKTSPRPRFTAFMSFLTEMFCQLKRRQLQLRTRCDGVSPPIVLLTLLAKSCDECVKPPVRSLPEIETLFFVLTCIGRDLETNLPSLLESLLSLVRDAFLNSSASQPAIRRTLLQLIELQASKWQMSCSSLVYYYPSSSK